MSKLYAILPEAAVEWERRKIAALAQFPQAQINEDTKRDIEDRMDESREYIKQYLGMMYNQRRPMQISEGVAIIHAHDFLVGQPSFFEKCMGASAYEDIAAEVKAATLNPDVKAVMIDADSGGGSALGCVEVGRLVSKLSAVKETAFFSETMCCSAMYAIAVGARRRYATESAMIGSIGTIMTFMDYEGMLAANGITPHIITSKGADLKAAGNQFRSPTGEELKHMQGMVDEYASQFVDHVWDSNPGIDVENGFRGQALSGRKAVEIGFIDKVATRDEVLSELKAWASIS